MAARNLLSIVESPKHPQLAALCERLGLEHRQVNSVRKAVAALKKHPPTFVVADFIYGWSNNYSGVHISNLDTFLASLPKYGPETRVVVLAEAAERDYAEQLGQMFPLHAILTYPVTAGELEPLLDS